VQPAVDLAFPQTEDCLFLDVYVPGAAVRNPSSSSLPVLFWIFGGGYGNLFLYRSLMIVLGSKDMYGGEPLLQTSNNSIIYVRTNYRVRHSHNPTDSLQLGAFGFLAGPTFQNSGGVANAGLLDQKAALQWTQKYISYLGGDPNRYATRTPS
jgi:carboxylesterase type B